MLEPEPQTEFDLSRIAYLSIDQAESRRVVKSHRWVAWLEMVQHVGELGAEGQAHALVEPYVFCDAEVQVPSRQAADRPGGPTVGIETQHQAAELGIDFIRVGEHVDSGSPAIRRVGVQPHSPGKHLVLMGAVAARVSLRQYGVLPGAARAAVHFAE